MWQQREAEFYALTRSASRALGAAATAADMAKAVKPHVRVTATASKAIASRRGVGRVRHLHTRVCVGAKGGGTPRVDHRESAGVENPADMGTEHLAQREMNECLKRAGCHITGGRARMAFEVAQRT